MRKIQLYIFPSILIIIFAIQAVTSYVRMSPTFDESTHIAAGFSYVKTNDYSFNYEHPPLIKQIAAIPLLFMDLGSPKDYCGWREGKIGAYSHFLLYEGNDFEKIFFWSRLMIVIMSMVLGIFLFVWSKELWGYNGALFSLFLFSFSPNIIANSGLVTTDMGITMFFFVYFYCLFRFLQKPNMRNAVFVGFALGGTLASKFSSLSIFPITAFMFAVFFIEKFFLKNSHKEALTKLKVVKDDFISYITKFFLIFLIAIVLLWVDYGFEARPYPFHNYLGGLKSGIEHSKRGHWAYFLGEIKEGGWFLYFPITFLIKTPVATMLLLLLSIVFFIARKYFKEQKYLILIPPLIYFAISCITNINIGYRHILPILPFIFLISGCLFKEFKPKSFLIKSIIVVLSLWYVISAEMIYPYHLTYFNEIIGGPKNGYKYLGDSNLDWGQGIKELKKYTDKEGISVINLSYFGYADPTLYGINYIRIQGYNNLQTPLYDFDEGNPPSGVYAISVTNLQGIYLRDFDTYKYFRDREPIARVGNCVYVYIL